DHLPPDGQQVIAEDIVNNSDLHALADHYFSAILLPIRVNGGKTPTALPTPRTGDIYDIDNISAELTVQKRNQAKLKAECLARDNNRCMLTGFYDHKAAMKYLSDEERRNFDTASTEAA